MKILSLDVQNLHGHYNLELNFCPEVTILAGINGSFKSTILHLLRDVTRMQFPTVDVKRVQINYHDDLKIYYYANSRAIKGQSISRRKNLRHTCNLMRLKLSIHHYLPSTLPIVRSPLPPYRRSLYSTLKCND